MELQRKYIPHNAVKNMFENQLLPSVSNEFDRVLVDTPEFYFLGVEIDRGKSIRQLMAVPYPIDPTSDDFYDYVKDMRIVKLPTNLMIIRGYGVDEKGRIAAMGPEEELYADAIEGSD